MKVQSIKSIKSLSGRTVLLRTDFNVPLKGNKVADNYKIEKSLPTIEYLLDRGAKVIIVSHLGRPKGIDKKLSLKPVAHELAKLLAREVVFIATGDRKKDEKIKSLKKGEVCLLDNIRFIPEEDAGDVKLAKEIAQLADVFVLDGFAVAHRDAPSVTGVAKFLPTYAGLLMEAEIDGLNKVVGKPKKPMVVVLGGAKMETKIPVLNSLIKNANNILLGGGIVNTYLWATGHKVGASLIDKKYKKEAIKYCCNKKIVLPVDVVVGKSDGSGARVINLKNKLKLNKNEAIFDVGPETIHLFAKYIKKASTLVWNGALGYFEQHPYEYGTRAVARLFSARSRGKAFGVCGGGETVELLRDLKLMEDIDLVSTGGGAMLEYLSGKKLPGVKVVTK